MTSTTALVCLALVSVFVVANGCTDSTIDCASWAKSGFCTNAAYTEADRIKLCQKTCNLCNGICEDIHPSCPDYIKAGFCTNPHYSEEYKKSKCPASCGFCVSTELAALAYLFPSRWVPPARVMDAVHNRILEKIFFH